MLDVAKEHLLTVGWVAGLPLFSRPPMALCICSQESYCRPLDYADRGICVNEAWDLMKLRIGFRFPDKTVVPLGWKHFCSCCQFLAAQLW